MAQAVTVRGFGEGAAAIGQCRRLGYLMETVGLPESQALLPHIGRGPMAYLSTVLPKRTQSINDKWGILINVPKEVLLEWREVW